MHLWTSFDACGITFEVLLPASEVEPLEGLVRSVRNGRVRAARPVALTHLPRAAPASVDRDAIEHAITELLAADRRSTCTSSCRNRHLVPPHGGMDPVALSRARFVIERFNSVADAWRLSRAERSLMVALPAETCVEFLLPWVMDPGLLSRMQCIVHVWLYLHQCVDDPSLSRRWLCARVGDPPFAGQRVVDLMVNGQTEAVWEYLSSMSLQRAEAEIRRVCEPLSKSRSIDDLVITSVTD